LLAAVLLTVGSVVVGAVIAILIGRYWYKRTFRYRLAVYCIGASQLLTGFGPEVRNQIRVNFKRQQVKDLTELHLLMANEGVAAIKAGDGDLISRVPDGMKFASASLVYSKPERGEIQVELSNQNRTLSVTFPRLNPSDFFVLKVIVTGNVAYRDLSWTINAENLAPDIAVESDERVVISRQPWRDYGAAILAIGLTFLHRPRKGYRGATIALVSMLLLLMVGLSMIWALYLLIFIDFGVSFNAINVTALGICLVVGFIAALIGLIGAVSTIVSLFRPYKYFPIPLQAEGHITPMLTSSVEDQQVAN
jgi:hypothetical protein